jgi:hypothetical protein
MPNWWLQWAERIAFVLAEWWLRSRPGTAGKGPGTPPADPPAELPHPDAPVPSSLPPDANPPR